MLEGARQRLRSDDHSHDERDILAAGKGDREAFGRLVERHHRLICQFVQRSLGEADRETAEDIAQDVFLNAWLAAPRYRPRSTVKAWLLRIATNRCHNVRRERARKPRTALDPEQQDRLAGSAAEEPETRVVAAAELARIKAALADLPESQRAALLLRHSHDLPYAEIAEVLGTSVPAVESLLFRARRKLQQTIESDDLPAPAQVRRRGGVGVL